MSLRPCRGDCLRPMSPRRAQARANFAVLVAGKLPRGLRAAPEGLFREARRPGARGGACGSPWCAAHPCSFSLSLSGGGRELRLKQYLYDLGPLSALDHAALYDHAPERLRASELGGGRLCWTGVDYARRPAASMLAWGTCAELRAVRGRFSEAELRAAAACLRPLRAGGAVAARPFAERTYWRRGRRYDLHMCSGAYRPPSSLWPVRWPWARGGQRWTTRLPRLGLPGPDSGRLDGGGGWRFDSACRVGARGAGETAALFVPARGPAHRLLWVRAFDPGGCPAPRPAAGRSPRTELYSGKTSFGVLRLGKGGPFIASATERRGPHDALWWEGRRAFLVQASAAQEGSLREFRFLLDEVRGV